MVGKGFSVQAKIFFSTSLVAAAIIVCVAIYQVFVATPETTKFKEEYLAAHLDHAADELNYLTRERLNIVIDLARRGEFLHILAQGQNALIGNADDADRVVGNELAKMVESFPFIVGGGIFYEPYVFDPEKNLRGFYARWVPPVGLSRRVEFTTSKVESGVDYHDTDWYRTLIPNGWDASRHLYTDTAWTGPYRDPVSLVPMITVLHAMYSKESRLVGVASIDWNLNQVTETINASRPTNNSVAVLFSPGSKKFAAVAGLQGLNLEPIDKVSWMPYLLLNPPEDRYEMVRATNEDGIDFRAYSRLLDNDLVYTVLIPEKDILSEVHSIQWGAFIVLAAAALLAVAIGYAFTKKTIGRLPTISALLTQYAHGDLTQKALVPDSRDEIQEISTALVSLRNHLEHLSAGTAHLSAGEPAPEIPLRSEVDISTLNFNGLSKTLRHFYQEMEVLQLSVEKGDDDARFDITLFNGAWRGVGKLANQIVARLENSLMETISICEAATMHEPTGRLLHQRSGMFERVRIALNAMFDRWEKTVKDLRIENNSLNLVRKEALVAARGRNVMLASVCDEYQQLLKSMHHSLARLRPKKANTETDELFDTCNQAVASLLSLTDEIQGYAQVELGNISVAQQPFNLHRLIFDIKDILRPHVVKRRQEFRLIVDPDVPEMVQGDMRLLRGTLLNLMNDSLRYAGIEGVVTVQVTLTCETTETVTLDFSISDTDNALHTERRKNALSCLDRGDEEGAVQCGGSGLGLLISSRLIELMGGSFRRETEMGIGVRSHFSLALLKHLATSAQPALQEDIEHSAGALAASTGILLVEDNVVSQKLVAELLRRRGFRVTVAEHGEEALKALEHDMFELVLMDIQLPVMDGFEATRRIRNSGKSFSKVPVIAITGHSERMTQDTMIESGLNGYLLKPLNPKALWQLLNELEIHSAHTTPPPASLAQSQPITLTQIMEEPGG